MIPYARQLIDTRDIAEVTKALKSDWITHGPRVAKFEEALCRYTGAKYAVAVSSGSAALHLACIAAGCGPKDKVITSVMTFAASASCALYVGADAVFIDIDDRTYHMDLEKFKDYVRAPSRRKKVKLIIPVHFAGAVFDVKELSKICDRYGIKIIEDAAHAMGAEYAATKEKWFKVGSCRHSEMTVLSFHPIKHMTTGEGGAVLTNDKKIYQTVKRLRHHGIVKMPAHSSRKRPANGKTSSGRQPWAYDIPEIGFNYRITDFQCALGSSQLKKLNWMVRERRRIVARYNRAFRDFEHLRCPHEERGTRASYHLYVLRVAGGRRNALYNYLRKNNVLTQVNYMPLHLLSFFRRYYGYKRGDYPVSERYFNECLSLPLYPGLKDTEQSKVIKCIEKFFKKARI